MTQGLTGELAAVVRGLVRRPAFGATVVLVMALGIGAVTTMFSTMDSVLLRPLPFDRPDDLVWLYSSSREAPRNSTSAPDYLDYRRDFRSFESLAAQGVFRPIADLPGKGEAEPYRHVLVSYNFFATLRAHPALGRSFVLADELAGGAHVVVVSHRFWQDYLDGQVDVVGRTLEIGGTAYAVIGVMPEGFAFPEGVDLWLPMRHDHPAATGRGNNNFSLFGRLKAGVGVGAARTEAAVLARNVELANPGSKKGWGLLLVPMHEVFFGDYRQAMTLLMGAVTLLLLVACANVSSLFLARGVSRRAELAVRSALGASRARLAAHVLIESAVLAAAGGAAGLGLAWAGLRAVRALAPASIPRVGQVTIDARSALVTVGACVVAGLVAGLAPALRGAKVDAGEAIKPGGRVLGSRTGTALRSGLIVAQLALSLVLLLGSGLLVRSWIALQRADVGFAQDNLLLADIKFPASLADDEPRLAMFYRDLADRVAAVPGVARVAIGEQLPFMPSGMWNGVYRGDRPVPSADQLVGAQRRRVDGGYFQALGIAILRGRAISAADSVTSVPVAVVNKALADRLWPGEDPIGKPLVLPWDPEVRMDVVGVAANIREFGPAADYRPTFYAPLAQLPALAVQLGVRTSGPPMAVASLVKRVINETNGSIIVSTVQTMQSRFATRTSAPRFRTALLSVFALIALVVAAAGLHGLLAFMVAERANELGVRLALGAPRATLLWLVVSRATRLAGVGLALGLLGGRSLSGLMPSLLYRVTAGDLPTFLSVAAALALVVLVSSAAPAWRAASLDPVTVLRRE